jgi:hypothetical protein
VAANPDLGIILVQHQGDVEVLDLATNQWRAIRGQENLNFGDRVRTGASGVASLEYRKENIALRIKPRGAAAKPLVTVRRVDATATLLKLDAVAFDVKSVTVNGKKARTSYDDATLAISVPEGDKLEVEITYRVVPKRGLYFIEPDDMIADGRVPRDLDE